MKHYIVFTEEELDAMLHGEEIVHRPSVTHGEPIYFMCKKHFPNDTSMNFDRDTALSVLKDISKYARPTQDLFGRSTLSIDRGRFEVIRRKYLDERE